MSEWTPVARKKAAAAAAEPADAEPKTRTQLKNKRRSEARKKKAETLEAALHDETDATAAAAARAELERRAAAARRAAETPRRARRSGSSGDLAADDEEDDDATPKTPKTANPDDALEESLKHLRKSTKALRQAEAAAAKLAKDPSLRTDAALVAKADKVAAATAAAAAAAAGVELAQTAAQTAATARAADRSARAAKRSEEARVVLAVDFDEKYACAVCTEVLEAAVATGACEHVFCRGCLEDHVALADKAADCRCPLCRAPLVGPSGKVEASAAAKVRAVMKKKLGRCHCGAAVPLSGLREHLRGCGPHGGLYPPRRKFGHSFRQPAFVSDKAPAPPRGAALTAAEEDRMLQAAILASLEGS